MILVLSLSATSSFASALDVKFSQLPTATIDVKTVGNRYEVLNKNSSVMQKHSQNEKDQLSELRHHVETILKKQVMDSGCATITGISNGVQSQCFVRFL